MNEETLDATGGKTISAEDGTVETIQNVEPIVVDETGDDTIEGAIGLEVGEGETSGSDLLIETYTEEDLSDEDADAEGEDDLSDEDDDAGDEGPEIDDELEVSQLQDD